MIWIFCEHTLDERLFQLRRGGRVVPLEPKVYDVLLHLLRHRDRVVSKSELLETIWPGEAVSESVLPRCVALARRALGDSRARSRVIQTVHGRGYRFIAELRSQAEAASASEPSAPQPGLAAQPHDGFVGRKAALERLEFALAEATRGRGRVCLLVGEPGIGKTRSIAEIGQRARRRGVRWLEGRCYEGEGAPAYWPFMQVLRALIATDVDDRWREDIGAGAADLHGWAPELSAASAEGGTPDAEQARFRLFDSVANALKRASQRVPIGVVIDDLHQADPDSLMLFQFLAGTLRESRVLLLGTYRDVDIRRDHPLGRTLAALAREAGCERVLLRGLERAEIAALGHAIAGRELEPKVVEALEAMTEGNPFFVEEIVRLLLEQGRLARSAEGSWSFALPQSVRDVVGRRLDSLSPECNAMLRAAAVLGRDFRGPVLERMLEHRAEELLELLGEALAARVLVERGGGMARFGFDHALTRQTLYDELSVPMRVQLHRRAGLALEAAVAAGADIPLAEIAVHFFEAVPGGDAERALEYGMRAAREAHSSYAYEESARCYERALETLVFRDPGDEALRCELLIELGEELRCAGLRERARAQHDAAARIAQRLERPDLFALAAIGYRGYGEMGAPPDDRTLELLRTAHDWVGEQFPGIRARLLALLVGCPPWSDSMAQRESLSQEAVRLAECSADCRALEAAAGARYWATLGPDRVHERLEAARRARVSAAATGDMRFEQLAHEMELGAHLILGDADAAYRALDAYSRTAETLRMPLFRFLAGVMHSSRALTEGRFEQALQLAEQARALGSSSVPYADTIVAGQSFWVRTQRRDFSGLPSDLEPILASLGTSVSGLEDLIRTLVIRGRIQRGEADAARADWEELAGEDFRDFEHDENWLILMAAGVGIAVALQDRRRMDALYEQLLPYATYMVSHDLLRAVACSVSYLLGTIDAALGRNERAIERFEAALERELRFAAAPALVDTRAALASALRRRGTDRERVEALERQARASAETLGIRTPELR